MYQTKRSNNNNSNSQLRLATVTKNSSNKQPFSPNKMGKEFMLFFAFLITVSALLVNHQAQALSLISEKCDPNKVGPDETTVKGGWQAEMFNGLSFRTCGKFF